MTTRQRYRSEFFRQLEELQEELKWKWVDKSLPMDWHALDYRYPIDPKKERVTIRLDADMLKWFRKMGPGYQTRINMVLRLYWTALQTGLIHSHYEDHDLPMIQQQAMEMITKRQEELQREAEENGWA
ncbi:MAG: BrnA antitoxin family protein [Paracoccaceae bacterium]